MNIRAYTKEDYPRLAQLWQLHNWPVLPEASLPATGAVATVGPEGEAIAFAFLYKTDSNIAWLEWLVGDPTINKFERRTAISMLIETLVAQAQADGFSAIFTSTNHPSLHDRLMTHQFQPTDQGVTQMIRRIA